MLKSFTKDAAASTVFFFSQLNGFFVQFRGKGNGDKLRAAHNNILLMLSNTLYLS